MLNRAALIVRPSEPFLEWARSLDDSGVVPDPSGERTVYLIPEFDSIEEAALQLPTMFVELFESELFGWNTDTNLWPKDRSAAAFKDWFTVELHTAVEDFGLDPLDDDDDQR